MGIVEGIIAGASILGAVTQYQSAQEQKKSARRQMREQQRLAEAQNIQNIREQVRRARAQSGQVTNLAALGGVSQSSGTLGGLGSIQSQLASNIGFQNQTAAIQNRIGEIQLASAEKQANYAMVQGVAGAVGNVADAFRGPKPLQYGRQTNPANVSRGGGFTPSQ